ncbi:MAG: Gfo/Idh/MocA family oxidoreductase [Phycisphaeraceae bacterium]
MKSKATPSVTPIPRPPVGTKAPAREIQIAAIGIDSSHLPEFAKRIRKLRQDNQTRCRVTQMWTDGIHKMPEDEVRKWQQQAEAEGVVMTDSMDDLLDAADGVMVLAVDGNRHLELAEKALMRGLPTYIDKPLACNLPDALKILELSQKHNAPCYSASSLRFANEVKNLDTLNLGQLEAIDAYGPGELNPAMKGLYFYGIHTIEMVDAMWGGGVAKVRCDQTENRDIVQLIYKDGRYAHLRMDRRGAYDFGATVHGSQAIHSFKVDFSQIYDRLIEGMVRFFEGGEPPATLDRLVEAIAIIETAHQSAESDGRWLDMPPLD